MRDDTTQARRDPFTALLLDTVRCIRFYSRIPVPALPFETDPHGLPDFTRIVRMLPVASLFIALPAATTAILAGAIWEPWIAALLAICISVWSTGAFHEDGLADTADGFGGGATPERRLEIMTDSRVGTFGAAAIVLSILLRSAALAEIMSDLGTGGAALAILAAAPLSRSAGLIPLHRLPNAKPDGKSAAVGRPGGRALTVCISLAIVIAVLILQGAEIPPLLGLIAVLAGLTAAMPVVALSRRMIGGQTGDVAGAAQQVSELAFLLVIAATAAVL
jgi:adenosylcobinamide-GDP ribazoletransferase